MKFILHFKSGILMLVVLGWGVSFLHAHEKAEIPFQKEKLLIEVLDEISREHQVFFTYDSDLIRGVTVDYEKREGESVRSILTRVLAEVNMDFKIFEERFVILYSKDEAGLESLERMISHMEQVVKDRKELFAARRVPPVARLQSDKWTEVNRKRLVLNVTGRVMDANGEPLIGVNIQVKGTNKGASTDIDGRFSLSDIDDQAVLVVSYIGYKTQEVSVSGETSLTIVMQEDVQTLDEVVVVGYGTQKKVNLTGAVANVGSEVLESRPISSIGEGLQGTVANLNVTQSDGKVGGGPSFNIRGFTSINGGGPLILLNGVPMNNIHQLNPNDIESISVLKDAASAAIYGARAAYGVILITTKSGKSNEPKISISTNYSLNKPTVRFETMDAFERMEFLDFGSLRASGQPYFPEIQRQAIIAHYNDPSQPTAIADQETGEWIYSANTNWPNELLKNNYPMQQYNTSISGKGERFNYYTSVSFFNQKGITKRFDENYDRFNLMSNLKYEVLEGFDIGTKILLNKNDKTYPPTTQRNFSENTMYFNHQLWPHFPVYNPDGTYAHGRSVTNFVHLHEEGGYRTRGVNDAWVTGSASLTMIKNMSFNIDYTFNVNNREEFSYWRQQPMHDINGNVFGYFTYTFPNQVEKNTYQNKSRILNAYADYQSMLGKHNLKMMVGFNQEYYENTYFSVQRQNLIKDEVPFVSLASGEQLTDDAASEYSLRGVFSRLNYNYDNKYLLEINGRYDGTSKFPKVSRFALFPSISIGWRLDNEILFSGLNKIFDLLKLRMSYGNLGNQNVSGRYPYISTLNSGRPNYIIGGERPLYVRAPGLVSANLTWEKVVQKDLGIDIAVFSSRLNVTFDVYRRDTKNMLTKGETLPALLGTGEPQENAADLKTTGFDLTIDWQDHIQGMSYGITVLLSDNISEITRFSNPEGLINDYYVGYKLGEIWGLETGGFFKTDDEAKELDQTEISGRPRFAGDIYFKDLDGDGRITRGSQTLDDHGDLKIIGNSTPRYSFGIKPYVKWSGFDFTLFLQGVAQRDTRLNNSYFLDAYINPNTGINKLITDYWTPENTNAYFPAPVLGQGNDVTTVQSRFLQNSAYVRLKQLTLGYSVSNNFISRLNIDQLRFYFSGNNLWEATKMINVADPEMGRPIGYPINRAISFGINIDF